MPFHDFAASKLVMIITLLLVHNAVVSRCAPPGSFASKSAPEAVPAVNQFASNTTTKEVPLLDETKLSFLGGCQADQSAKQLCELYRSLVTTVLSQRKPEPVTVDEVQQAIAKKLDANSFCDDLAPVLRNRKAKHPELMAADSPLEQKVVCNLRCVALSDDMVTVDVKPICKVLLWGFQQELLLSEALPEDPAKKAVASVVIPPMLPENVQLPEVAKHDVLPVDGKPAEAVAPQSNATVPEKTVENPSVPKTNGAIDTEESVADTAVVKVPSDTVVEKSQATTGKATVPTASNVQQKQSMDNEDNEYGDNLQDANEKQNQNNIKHENVDDRNDNTQEFTENSDEMDSDEQSLHPEDSPANEGTQLDPDTMSDKDLDAFGVEQPAAAAVQIERVDPFFDQDDSNFFFYFMFMMFACIMCYVAYHNKSKLLALLVEGRRSNSGRGGFSKGGRKHTAAYRKLDSNLEEAITSNASASSRSTSQIIY